MNTILFETSRWLGMKSSCTAIYRRIPVKHGDKYSVCGGPPLKIKKPDPCLATVPVPCSPCLGDDTSKPRRLKRHPRGDLRGPPRISKPFPPEICTPTSKTANIFSKKPKNFDNPRKMQDRLPSIHLKY